MRITDAKNTVNIRLMRLWCQRIAQKNDKIDVIVLDLRAKLLCTAEMPGEIFVNI